MLLGCLVAVMASGGAAAVFVLEEVHNLRDALNERAPLQISRGALVAAGWGDPQTLLLVGNDERKHTTTTPVLPHSNEMLLVRLDPSKPWISMMSLDRNLMVPIHTPGGVVENRLNAALTFGCNPARAAPGCGISLLVKTIQQVMGVPINHVVEIDFNNFARAVNEIGCVYSTVDRRYYHRNLPDDVGPQYMQIDLQPGYQRMCGQQALQFVSYRHGDTSLVRDARDQDFLLDVKRQYGPTLVDNAGEFERIFGQTVQTDAGLHNTDGILNLLGTLVSAVNKPVRQVQFQDTLQPTGANFCSCDTASPQQIRRDVDSWLYGAPKAPRSTTAAVVQSLHGRKAIQRLPLVGVSSSELASARHTASHVPFPFEFPRVQDKGGAGQGMDLRHYLIRVPGGAPYPAYVAVFSAGQIGQYYDVQGSPWTTQPQLDSPDQAITVGGRRYYLYYSGQHLRIVAWYAGHDVYWVHNSLTDAVGNGELLAIAEQTVPINGSHALAAQAQVSLRAAKVPLRLSTSTPLSLSQKLGSILALVALILLVPLLFLLVRRWLDLRRVRQGIAANAEPSGLLAARAARLPAPSPGWAPGRAAAVALPAGAGGGGVGALAPGGAVASLAPGGAVVLTPRRPTADWAPVGLYRSRRRPRLVVVLGMVLVLAAGAGLGVLLTFAGSRVYRATNHSTTHRRSTGVASSTPTVPVVVLNASSLAGAAGRLSPTLQSEGVKVSGVGNLSGPRPAGVQILFAAGEHGQARRLAHVMSAQDPSVAPIDPAAAGAAGNGAKLVVVIG
jgi:LCP family protein required for cell wall assembly